MIVSHVLCAKLEIMQNFDKSEVCLKEQIFYNIKAY